MVVGAAVEPGGTAVIVGPPAPGGSKVVVAPQPLTGVAIAGTGWIGLQPGRAESPIKPSFNQYLFTDICSSDRHTAIVGFGDLRLLSAPVNGVDGLSGKDVTCSTEVIAAVHCLLKRVPSLSEHIISMLTSSSPIEIVICKTLTGKFRRETYGSPMLNTKGCAPPVGHMLLNWVVSQIVSIKSWGKTMGWVDGHPPYVVEG